MSSTDNHSSDADFGANEWLVAEMYGQWLDRSWWPILERYQLTQQPGSAPVATTPAPAAVSTDSTVIASYDSSSAPATEAITVPVAKASVTSAANTPVPANLPAATGAMSIVDAEDDDQPEVNVLRGMAKTLASNMDASLTVPTATSVRQVAAKLLIDNRIVINSHLKRTRGGKVSFTHLIGYAVVQA
ncbi:MAG: hypothetical protein RL024_982, partial [Actinomycetota bacterium]